jgi:hypothetical protein
VNPTVVIVPGTVLCPECSHVLHPLTMILGGAPPPERVSAKCLNSRCDEHGIVKVMLLQRVNVEVAKS